MKISVSCLQCHRHYEVDGRFAGKTLQCTHCRSAIAVPVAKEISQSSTPISNEYELATFHEITPSNFNTSPANTEYQSIRSRKLANAKKKIVSRKKPIKRRRRPEYDPTIFSTILVSLAVIAVVLAILGYFVPSARKTTGVALALPGLLLCVYGYATAVYIAFTEDDFYGWLFLLIPFFAAYYVVSRWDEMRSRLVIVGIGLALLTVGGRLLEANLARERTAAAEAARKD